MLSLLSVIAVSLMLSEGVSDTPDGIRDSLQTITVVADRGVVVSKRDVVQIGSGDDISSVISSVPGLTLNEQGSVAGGK